jgi:hypothetical protein
MEVDGKNYLIPIDAKINAKVDIKYEAVPVNLLIDKMEKSNNRLNIVVLDACRNDPFDKGYGGGLAQIKYAKGIYIAYATAAGSVASDGNKNERNGLFTKYLLKNIKKQNLELDRVFKNVRIAVSNESNDKQQPWNSSSVNGDFYFKISNIVNYENINPTNQALLDQVNKLKEELKNQKKSDNNKKLNPTLIGSIDTDGKAWGVALSNDGKKAYVANGYRGLKIIDISNPNYLTILGSIDIDGIAFGVALSNDGKKAYIADTSKDLKIIDISNPKYPTLLGSIDTDGYALSVVLSNDDKKVYVANGKGLKIIDISNPNYPTLLSSIDTDGSAGSVVLSNDGTKAYIADWDKGLKIIDLYY